jgi:outer membrane protein W
LGINNNNNMKKYTITFSAEPTTQNNSTTILKKTITKTTSDLGIKNVLNYLSSLGFDIETITNIEIKTNAKKTV